MIDQFEIFKRVRDCEVAPPAEVMLRIFDTLEDDFKKNNSTVSAGQLEQLQELEIYPPLSVFTAIEQKVITSFQLSFLKNIEVAPPLNVSESIFKRIESEKKLNKIDKGTVVKMMYRYRAAIAVILIAGISWFTYQIATTQGKHVTENVAKNKKPVLVKVDSTVHNTLPINDNKTMAVVPVKKRNTPKEKVIVEDEKAIMTINDYKFIVKDNDLLASFTMFDYRNMPSFISEPEPKGFMIRVDQYTAISVSGNMSKMIQRMNLFRHNGSLKPRARKARAKLDKWKKADTEHFDQSLINNPIDPLDLAEFIFNNE